MADLLLQPFAGAPTGRIGRRPVIAAGFLALPVPALPPIRQGSASARAPTPIGRKRTTRPETLWQPTTPATKFVGGSL
ncbi:hypothetical protein [Streptomyces sp. NPDC002580]|uniref:hypothetical protein n=1 Tax=Streptomyces sp. NPDC002580 TaxID=3364653 RepID=UPI00367A84B8